MVALLCFFLTLLVSPFKSKSRLEAENVALRRQLIIFRRKMRGRVHLTNGDRLFFVQLYRWLDWHDLDSSVIASVAESVDQEAEPGSNLLGLRCIRRAARDAVRTARIAVVAWTASR